MGLDWITESSDVYASYETAFGAVVFGVVWNGHDVDEVSNDEALSYAADFLKKLRDLRMSEGYPL